MTDDPLRPAAITTYDMKGDLARTLSLLNRSAQASAPSDIAADSDNDWTDGAVVDAHVYAGWYYDFISKRFGSPRARHPQNLRMPMIHSPGAHGRHPDRAAIA